MNELEPFIHNQNDSMFLLHLLREAQFLRGNQDKQTEFLEYIQNLRKKTTPRSTSQAPTNPTVFYNLNVQTKPTDTSKSKLTGSKPQEPTLNHSFLTQDDSVRSLYLAPKLTV
jgi:hypothetical protein